MKKTHTLLLTLFFLFFSSIILAQPYTSGQTYFGTSNYIEYKAGNLPIIISAPHGGDLEPAVIPDRNCAGCSYIKDANTQEVSREMSDAIFNLFGCYPHVIINRLHRKKLDANREIVEAADGDPNVEIAWQEFHDFIDAAKTEVINKYGKGLFIDIHGHGHTIQRLELGYLISKSELQLANATLDQNTYVDASSIKNLVNNNLNNFSLSELLKGLSSFGELYEQASYPSVPSQTDPAPMGSELYFSGGYNTERHGSMTSGSIDAIQIECNMTGVRDNATNRANFAAATALVLKDYLETHYFGANFMGPNCALKSAIPTISEWGLIVLALLFMTLGVLWIVHIEVEKKKQSL